MVLRPSFPSLISTACHVAHIPGRPHLKISRTIIHSATSEGEASTSDLITVTIKKPMGMILAENSNGQVFVEEIIPESNAEKSGVIRVGDVLAKTSATVLKSNSADYGKVGHGQRLYDNWEQIEFDCTDQTFDTVMSAIASNNERWGINKITLTLKRQDA